MKVINPDACTVCRACQLVCSLLHTGGCHPDQARIGVALPEGARLSESGAGVTFLESCTGCGACAAACLYGVLATEQGPSPAWGEESPS